MWIIQSKRLHGLLLHDKAGNDGGIYKAPGSIMAQQKATTKFVQILSQCLGYTKTGQK